MDPHFCPNDKLMFYKYLDNATTYLEYGSGGSTYQASIRNNVKQIISVESDLEWYNKLINTITNKNHILFKYIEMDTQPNNWGYPGSKSNWHDWFKYSNVICELDIKNNIDLILIDGRFRVACCLKCFDVINDDCLIIFDDFLNRKPYHVVLDYYEIIDKTIDNVMVVLKKKNVTKPSDELINSYINNTY
jgi:hypothetical protein